MWSSISGSVGGITYLNGPHAAIIARARVVPVQPGTLFQAQAKSAWNSAAATWESLTQGDQDLWDDYALTVVHQGKQGNYTVTGRSMFMAGFSLARYLQIRILDIPTIISDPPTVQGFLLPSLFSLAPPSAAGTGFSVNITADPASDTNVFIETSKGFNKERNFWKGPWVRTKDKAQIVPKGTSTAIDIINLTVDLKYFCRVKCVADDDPLRVSEQWFGSTIAQTTI